MDLHDLLLDRSPRWLLERWGMAWQTSHGATLESFVQAAREATKARLARYAPTDALSYRAANVGFVRGFAEPLEAFRLRILEAWARWEICGTPRGIEQALDALYPSNPPSAVVQEYWDGGFTPDDTRWARFRVEMTIPHWGTAPHWDAFHWDDGTHWDITAPEPEIRLLRETLHQWTPAYARCERLRIFGAGGTVVDIPDP